MESYAWSIPTKDQMKTVMCLLFNILSPIFTGHAKDALELSKLQESTRQQEYMAKIKEYEAAIEQSKVELKRVDYEERRKTLQVILSTLATFTDLKTENHLQ